MPARTLQRNAADPKQVRYAERKAQQQDALFLDALRIVLGTPAGRVVHAGWLRSYGLDRTVYDHSGSTMYFNEGRRNAGLEMKARCIEASETLFEQMEREERARQRADLREATAVQTPAAGEEAEA